MHYDTSETKVIINVSANNGSGGGGGTATSGKLIVAVFALNVYVYK